MIPRYSKKSIDNLLTGHPLLQILMLSVTLDGYDNKIEYGERGEDLQNEMFDMGWTTLRYPDSNHNKKPDEKYVYAVDAVPYPVQWPDLDKVRKNPTIENLTEFKIRVARLYYFSGYVRAKAKALGIPIRQGSDWNMNFVIRDQNFHDVPHIEIVRKKLTNSLINWSMTEVEVLWTQYREQTRR